MQEQQVRGILTGGAKHLRTIQRAFLIILCAALPGKIFATTTTFNYTGAVQMYTVPAGINSISVDARGARGGGSSGGNGGRVVANLAVTAGQVLNIFVGGAGQDAGGSTPGGYNGGGHQTLAVYGSSGGGASDIRTGGTALANRVIVAGGGGGGSFAGGAGGGLTGGDGISDPAYPSLQGFGGSQISGGTPGLAGGVSYGDYGVLGFGGNVNDVLSSTPFTTGGGGGGGGYYGGGGGGSGINPGDPVGLVETGNGGGGSSYTDAVLATSVSHTQGFNGGDGIVIVSAVIITPTATTFNETGGMQTYTVPAGVISLHVDIRGAKGGGPGGGNGGEVTADLAVTAGQVLNIFVGGAGALPGGLGGYNGGGRVSSASPGATGGGASDIRIGGVDLTSRVIVAGGGGGEPGGGNGGGLTGGNGGTSPVDSYFLSGPGGTQTGGGALGYGEDAVALGMYPVFVIVNGAGGGGYYGGGCGGLIYEPISLFSIIYTYSVGGGGGGSSYTDPVLATSVSHTQGFNAGDGVVTILPIMITGTSTLCTGSSTTLSYATTDGVWASDNTGVATVGSTTGVVSGIIAGTATISYITPGGTASTVVTVAGAPPISSTGDITQSMCNNVVTYLPSITGATSTSFVFSGATTLTGSGTGSGQTFGNGTTQVFVIAGNACGIDTSRFAVTIISSLIVNAVSLAGCGGGNGGRIAAFVENEIGGLGITYHLTGPTTPPLQNNGSFTLLSPGVYEVFAASSNCPILGGFATVTVSANPLPTVTATPASGPCSATDGNLVATITGLTTPPYTYAWSNSTSLATATGLADGTYSVTVTDGNGCTGTASAAVGASNPISFTATATQPTCVVATGSVSLSVPTGGNGGISYNSTPTTGLTAGNYTYIATDINGCSASHTVTINAQPVFTLTSTITQPTCSYNTGSILISGSSGSGPGSTILNAGGLGAGNYTYTLTDAYGCTGTTTAVITTPPAINFTATVTQPTSVGGTGSVALSATGGTGAFTYSGSATTGLNAGTYTYTVTDANSCTATTTAEVTAPLVMTITGTTDLCAGSSTTLTYATSAGTWTSSDIAIATVGSATGIVTGVAAGTATISYAINGEWITSIVTVHSSQSVFVAPVAAICLGSTSDGLGGGVGGSAISAVWSDDGAGGTFANNSGFTPATATYTSTGSSATPVTLTLTTHGTATCNSASASVLLTINPLPSVIATPTNVSCNSANIGHHNDGTVSLSITGGTPSYLYIWSNGSSQATATGLPTGTYNVTVLDANHCHGSASATVGQPTAVGFTATVTQPTCSYNTGSVLLGGESGGTGAIVHAEATATTGLTTGHYHYVAEDDNGCEASQIIVITNPPAISFAATVTQPTCTTTGSVALSASGGTGAFTYSGSATTGLNAGNYTYTVTDANSCTATTTAVLVASPSTPDAATISGEGTVCVGATTTLTSSTTGGTWSSGNISIATVGSTGIVTGVHDGTATITYAVSSGCGTVTATAVVTVNTLPTVAGIAGAATVCRFATTTLTDATVDGVWSSDNITVADAGSTGIITGVSGGIATISYTITNSCGTVRATKTITVTPPLDVASISGVATVCAGAQTTFTDVTTGGVWSSSNASIATVGSTGVVTGVGAGTTIITYSISTSCGTQGNLKAMTVNPLPAVAAISGTGAICFGGAHLTLTEATSGGTWSSSATGVAVIGSTGVVTSMSAGTATISYTVTNSCGPTKATAIVTVNMTPTVATIAGAATVCQLATTTLTDATAGGVWSSSNTAIAAIGSTGIVTGISGGSATISYTITNSCGTVRATKTIRVAPVPNVSAISGAATICAGAYTIFTDATTGGVWSSGSASVATVGTAGVVTGVAAGTAMISYSITNSCGSEGYLQLITVNPLPAVAAISGAGIICSAGAHLTLTDVTSGGTWSSSNTSVATIGASGIVTSGTAVGTATISYTVTNGCGPTRATAIVTVNTTPTVATIAGAATICQLATTTLTDATAGGVWSSSNAAVATAGSTGIITGVSGGSTTISYAITNACGTTRATKTMTVTPLLNVAAISGAATVCVAGHTTFTDATAGGTWSSGNTAIATVSAAGVVTGAGTGAGVATISYSVANACGTVRTTKTITVNAVPTVATITGTATVNTGATTALADATASGTWSAGNTHATVSAGVVAGVSAGTVTISYTVSNSCGSAVATKVVTVNAALAAITGTKAVCKGATTTLSDATAGGTWSSSSTAVALCGGSGIITGVSAGTATITYTASGGHVTAVITVNALPAAITGSSSVVVGANITLADATAGGTWSSSTTHATVGAGTGAVHGASSGTAVIYYTLGTGCASSKSITVGGAHRDASNAETEVAKVAEGMDISVMPNPNNGIFHISGFLGSTDNDEVVLEVTNMLGQVVYQNKIVAQNGVVNEQVRLNTVANGMYILTLSSDGQHKAFHIIVRQ